MKHIKECLFAFYTFLGITFWSCGNLSNPAINTDSIARDSILQVLSKSWPIIEPICRDIGAKHAGIYSNTNNDYIAHTTTRYLVLNIDSCSLVREEIFTQQEIASYCATQLYIQLDSEIIVSHDGIRILFDNENADSIFDNDRFYFTMASLDTACSLFDFITDYMEAERSNDINRVSAFIDTNYFSLDLQELHDGLIKAIDNKPYSSFLCYDYYDYVSKDSSQTFRCYSVFVGLVEDRNIRSSFGLLIPTDFKMRKIINYRFNQ